MGTAIFWPWWPIDDNHFWPHISICFGKLFVKAVHITVTGSMLLSYYPIISIWSSHLKMHQSTRRSFITLNVILFTVYQILLNRQQSSCSPLPNTVVGIQGFGKAVIMNIPYEMSRIYMKKLFTSETIRSNTAYVMHGTNGNTVHLHVGRIPPNTTTTMNVKTNRCTIQILIARNNRCRIEGNTTYQNKPGSPT